MKALIDVGLRSEETPDWISVGRALNQISVILTTEKLNPVTCIERDLLRELNDTNHLGSTKGAISRVLTLFLVWQSPESPCEAHIEGNPVGLSSIWKQRLRETLLAENDWRVPQILVSKARRSSWPATDLVSVSADVCQGEPAIPARAVPLVQLDAYETHPHARADRDPWDVRVRQATATSGEYACLLPKPPSCVGVPIDGLREATHPCRVRASSSVWHYVPPRSWDPLNCSPQQWRSGRAFPRGDINRHHGYLDCDDNIWEWHSQEGHWDVQTGGGHYQKVFPTGQLKP